MSKDKEILKGGENEEGAQKLSQAEHSEIVENPLVGEDFTNRLIYSSTWRDERELLDHSRDYLLVKSLHKQIENSENLSFSEMKTKALNIVDDQFDNYRKTFNLPTELVALPVKCKYGFYYLSVNQRGYLCFYKDVSLPANKRVALSLVLSPAEAKKKAKN